MALNRILRVGLAAVMLQLATATVASAGTAQSISGFAFGAPVDSFTAFDPSLGTLTSVQFELHGQFEPLIVSDAAPVGTIEPLFITLSFSGLGGRGFSTISTPTLSGQIITNGYGAQATVFAPFRDSFTFDAASEAVGFTADSTGAVLSGELADFLPGAFSGSQIEELPAYEVYALGANGAILPSVSNFIFGDGTVTYTYTPAASAVTEPAAWVLLMLGIGVIGSGLRRRCTRDFVAA